MRSLSIATLAAIHLGAVASHADVVINELSATASDRLLRYDANAQPYVGSGHPWWSGEFDDALWQTGDTPIGFDLGTINTNVRSVLRGISPSLYVRKTFTASASEASSDDDLLLRINYNDGYIAWINGTEVGRSGMGPAKGHVYHDQLAYVTAPNSTTLETVNLGRAADLLQEGENVLAIQIGNQSLTTSMRLEMTLVIDAAGADPVLVPTASSVRYLPGLMEPSSDVYEPAAPENGAVDWVELCNTGASAVDISNWSLTDDPLVLDKWRFPVGTSIPAGGHLLVLADEPDAPIPNATFLHADLKLSSGGEYLGLFDDAGVMQSQFDPEFPRQYPFYSYGLEPGGGSYVYCAMPTPGAPNAGPAFTDRVDAPDFDNKGGFYDTTVTVTLTSETPGALIRYTTNGTEPTLDNGADYTQPLQLTQVSTRRGRVVRARAFLAGMIPSRTKTHTFLIGQDSRLRTSPALIYSADPPRSLYGPHGALAISGGQYVSNQWQPVDGNDYNNIVNRGRPYERPVHLEFYFPNGEVGFRTDAGVRVAASSWSRPRMVLNNLGAIPWQDSSTQKPSFNLYFRDDYGNPSVSLPLNGENAPVNSFERFRIRAGKNDIRNPFIIDELVRRMQRDMGHVASTGVNNSLYVNGDLKGFYNMVTRLREPFFRASHSEDPNAQWDVLQYEGNGNIAEGDKVAWNDMIGRLNAATTLSNWDRILEVVDVANVADYFLLNIYMAMWDWPHNNWVTARERSPAGRWRCYVWDAEGGMNNRGNRPVSQEMIQTHIASGSGELRDLWRGLNRWEEFQLLFADRINRHLFNGGVLDDRDYANSHVKALQDELVDEFSDLLSIMNGQTVDQSKPQNWANPSSGRRRYMFGPIREDFRNNGLWPLVTPPEFSQFGGSVANGFPLGITNETGLIYYTTDGSDPRLPGGDPNPSAIAQSGSILDVELVSLESDWKYNGTDGDLGTAWRTSGYNDAAWPSGSAPLGYGTISFGATVISISTFVNEFQPRQPTVYFRRTFDIDDASAFLELDLKIRLDAGAVVYLNGSEAFRDSNIPAGATYATLPVGDSSDSNEADLDEYVLDPLLLVDGTNTLAVELHNSPNSSDMVMDLQLDARRTNPGSQPFNVTSPVTIRARSFDNGVWSAVTEADFTVETEPATTANLAVVEMLYNPIGPSAAEMNAGFDDGDLFEWLRIENIGPMAIDLHGVAFVDGIQFDFGTSAIRALSPGAAAIVVSDLAAFRERFGTGFDNLIAGQYSGRLNNGGEHVRLIGASQDNVQDFTYQTLDPWPDLGGVLDGHSIQIIDPSTNAQHNDGANWRASANLGGNPGGSLTFEAWRSSVFNAAQLADPAISAWDADADSDGLNTFAEFALGTPPLDAANGGIPMPSAAIENIDGVDYLTLEYTRAAGTRAVTITPEATGDAVTWAAANNPVGDPTVNPDGSIATKFRDNVPLDPVGNPQRLMRLFMSE